MIAGVQSVRDLLSLGEGTVALPVALTSAYLAALSVAAYVARGTSDTASEVAESRMNIVVLVPAHDEADSIERCVRSLARQSYPAHLYEIVVIADNCTDATADVARDAGARVLVREAPDERGKGQALHWALEQLLREERCADAFAVIDADSVADPQLIERLVRRMERGAEVVQGEYLVLDEGAGPRGDLRVAAFLLFHRVRFAGRAALHLPCALVGNAMLFARSVLEEHPWNAFSKTEDLEYTIGLRLAQVAPAFAEGAVVRGPVAASGRAASTQRSRWEGGRARVACSALPLLVREIIVHRRWDLLDAAVDLAVPPLGLLCALTVAGSVTSATAWIAGGLAGWPLVLWGASAVLLSTFVLVGLVSAHAERSVYRALLWSPAFVVRKVIGTVGVLRSAREDVWVRTERRPGEVG